MSPSACDYLATLPAYVINLDRSTERWARVDQAIRPFVRKVRRVPGVDGELLHEEVVRQFRAHALSDEAIRSRQDDTRSMKNWCGSMGVYLAHIRAVEQGIYGKGPFIVLEDDARFYRQDLAEATDWPTSHGVHVWCGARKTVTHAQVAKMYDEWNGERQPWIPIVGNPRGRYTAVAYSFTDTLTAIKYLRCLRDHPGSYDAAWWPAMEQLPFYNLRIDIAQQEPFITPDRVGSGTSRASGPREYLLKSIVG